MDFLYSLFFSAGVTAFAYSKMSRRAGYGNTKSIATPLAVIFVIVTIVFYTMAELVFNIH